MVFVNRNAIDDYVLQVFHFCLILRTQYFAFTSSFEIETEMILLLRVQVVKAGMIFINRSSISDNVE